MIKECPVIMSNEAVTVARYDGIDIQFPSVGKDVKTVFVNKDGDGSYHIADGIETEAVDAGTPDEAEKPDRVKKQSKRHFEKKSTDCIELIDNH